MLSVWYITWNCKRIYIQEQIVIRIIFTHISIGVDYFYHFQSNADKKYGTECTTENYFSVFVTFYADKHVNDDVWF